MVFSKSMSNINILWLCLIQVQDIEFAQIEIKVIEGLKAGNDCLKQMHEVSLYRPKLLLYCNKCVHLQQLSNQLSVVLNAVIRSQDDSSVCLVLCGGRFS